MSSKRYFKLLHHINAVVFRATRNLAFCPSYDKIVGRKTGEKFELKKAAATNYSMRRMVNVQWAVNEQYLI